MRKLKLFLSLLMVMMISVGNVWAVDYDLVYTLDGSVTSTASGSSAYATAIDIVDNGITWNVMGNTTLNPWGIGGKNLSNTGRSMYSKGAVAGNILKIEIEHGAASSVTVNSMKVEVATDAAFANIVSTCNPTFAASSTVTVNHPDGDDAWEDCYYRITYYLTIGSSNKKVEFKSAKFYKEYVAPAIPTCATPTFDPEDGETFTDDIDVEIASATEGVTIYYTTDGNDPTTSSSVYSSALNFSETTTLKAMAVKAGYDNSAVATATYTKVVPFSGSILEIVKGDFTTSSYDDNAGDHEKSGITFTTAKVYQSGGGIQFQKTNGLLYNKTDLGEIAKIEITKVSGKANNLVVYAGTTENPTSGAVTGSTSGSVTTYTFAAGKGFFAIKCNSTGASNVDPIKIYYTSSTTSVAKPTISGADNFLTSTTVTITQADADHIYYTTNGVDPTTSSAEYTAPFTVDADGTTTVKAIAVKGSDVSGVATQTFTKATVMTVAQARAAIDAGGDLTNKFVAGIISQIDSYQSNYHSITYWISDDGTTTNQLQVYSGLAGVVKSAFASKDDLAVGDDVTVKGTLKKYNSTYEFDYNNTIEAYKPIARLAWSAESYDASLEGTNTFPTLENTNGVTVAYSSSDPTKASFADASVYEITLNVAGSTTITATFAGNETYKANSASYTLNIASSLVTLTYNVDGGEAIDPVSVSALPNPLPTTTKAGKNFGGWFTDSEKTVAAVPGAAISENTTLFAKWLDPYDITAAKAVIDENESGIANQYVAGIISQIDSYNNTYHSITYWISADGTTSNQLEVYSGLIGNAATALGKEAFSAKEDLELGDEVVVTGTLKKYGEVYEFDKNNTIYTFSRKASAGLEYAVTAVEKVVGDAAFINPLTNPNSVDVTYETSDDQVAEVANDGTVTINGEGSATISATFAGNGTYKAAQVSYTLTVSATVDTRHIANSPATFTTTNGNLAPADIAYASYQGGSSTAPAIYNDGIRLYQIGGSNDFGGFITLTAKAGCTIDEVQITTTSKYATTVAYSKDDNENLLKSESVAKSGSYTTGTGLNVSSVNILNLGTGSDGRLEIASIKVYYTGEPATIDHYELGGTYQTAFMQDEEFNHTGLIVYAAYDALGENKVDITSMCTFSEPDMSTTGEKTIEITYNEAVVISYTINVAADSRKVANSPAAFTTVSGDMTPNDISFASYQGEAGTAPANYNDGIRLYQAPSADKIGGYITLKAKKGCTIDQVKITTTNTYATTVAYSVDGNENLLGSESVAKSSDYSTPSGLNVESVNIVNKGTGSSGRLEIASIKVWYTGDPLAVDHYFLGGTYETTFEQNGTFDYTGLEVYASYDAGETITEPVEDFTVQADLSTAGDTKAEVYLNEVKIAEYDITVTAGKENPALAYNPASAIITAGDAWSAPTLSNTFSVSPITYSSDKESVATVDENGVITLAGGYGTAVITAHFDETAAYIESEATYTITVNKPAPTPTSTVYRKVTATADITDGEYLIVYEGDATHDAVVFDGSLDNVDQAMKALAVEIENDEIAGNTELDAAVFTIDVTAGSLQSASGLYIGREANSNGMDKSTTEAYVNTFAITDGEAVITGSAGPALRYNYASDQLRFRYYKSGQQAIQLYKKVVVEPEPQYTEVRTGLTAGWYYTMCLDKAVTAVKAGSIWKVLSKAANGNDVILEEVIGTLDAGRPYIFRAAASTLEVAYTGDAVLAPLTEGNNGLVGSFSQVKIAQSENNYIIYNNALYFVNTDNVYVGANRAYLDMTDVPNYVPSTPAPGRRRVTMTVYNEQTATGMDALNATDAPVKMMINGQMYILRGEKMYDVTGKLVK